MQNLKYVKPTTIEEAVSLLANGGATARVLAGGTDVIVQARERKREIDLFVDIKAIEETRQLSFDAATGLTVGAALPCYIIYNDETVKSLYPALADATCIIGGVAIQGRASLGGNLCNSSPAADSIPAMIVLAGEARVAGPNGRRSVPVDQFCTGPGRNVLAPGEFVVSIHFPAPAANSGAAWERFIPRNEMDIAVANAASALRFEGDTVAAARVAIGAVAPTPLMLAAAAEALTGRPLTNETIAAAATAASAAAQPIDDMRGSVRQRRHLASVLVERTLREAARRAGRQL
ncbi:MAG: xanthine dehydrogenase family protein subunit M [Dehalococcoidia bacterium]|nr:xanthine dehydrogenase family protein subunit M [Dehalococcoidia bacterium]